MDDKANTQEILKRNSEIAFLSPITFLTDLLRYSVGGSNYFTYQFDIGMLFIWIVGIIILGYFLHKRTMPKRLAETGKKQKMMKKKMEGMKK